MTKEWTNSKSWQDASDGWVTTMNKSKEDKEQYKKYADKQRDPMSYRDWLKLYSNSKT
tara:strand:+ start:1482 stop:1655 length:174 start_codon:yes stop_codon:yes gene_type:complete